MESVSTVVDYKIRIINHKIKLFYPDYMELNKGLFREFNKQHFTF